MHTNGRIDTDWRALRDNCLDDMVAARRERKRLRPQTRNQAAYFNAVEVSPLTVCLGPAGTGKTYMACGMAADMLKDGKTSRIVLSRPLLSCDEEMGFLPGGPEEKVAPFMAPLLDAFGDFFTHKELEDMGSHGVVEVCPLGHMRGRTFKNAVVILDEAQNATPRQMKMFLTRAGVGCKMVVSGDETQSDLPARFGNVLRELVRRVHFDLEVRVVELTEADIVRSDLVGRLVRLLASWKQDACRG